MVKKAAAAPKDGPQPGEEGYFDVPEDARLTAFLREHGASADGTVRIYRLGPGGYRDQILENTCGLNEFEPGLLLQKPYYGGKFRIYVTIGDMTENFPLNVAVQKPDAVVQAVAPDPAVGLAGVVSAMMEGFKRMDERISATLAATPRTNPVEDALRMLTALQAAAPRAAPAADPLAMVTQIISLQKLLQPVTPAQIPEGGVDSGTIILEAIRTFGAPLADVLKEAAERKVRSGAPVAALEQLPPGQPHPVFAQPAQGVTLEQEESEMSIKMRLLAPVIFLAAQAKANPETYADIVLDQFSPEELATYIEAPDWFEQLSRVLPDIVPHREWVGEVRASIMDALTDPPEASKDTPGAGEAGSDVATRGTATGNG